MGYVNQSGSNAVIGSGDISLSVGKYIEKTETQKTTYYYSTSGQVFCGINVSFGYDTTQNKFYCSYNGSSGMLYIYNTTGKFKFKVTGGSTYKELVTVDAADGSTGGTADFRTDLECDLPKTDGEITYASNSIYNYYINNGTTETLIATTSSNDFMTYLTFSNSHPSVVETGSYTPGTSGSKKWSMNAFSTVWNYTSHIHQIKNTSDGSYYRFSLNGSSFSWSGSGTTSGGSISRNGTQSCRYQYVIESGNLNNTSQLQFTCSEMATQSPNYWTGLTSPYFESDLDGWFCILYPSSNFTVIQTSPAFTTSMGTGGQWSVTPYSSLPTYIGNVTCTNPEYINDYEQDASTDRNGNEPGDEDYDEDNVEKVRNNIFKICPKFNATASTLITTSLRTLTDSTWTPVNCTITNGEVVATDSGAYIYQDYYRPKYTSEQDTNNILNNTDFRQRHFTHFRYMLSTFTIKNDGESTFTDYRPDISLIYKPYGTQVEVSGHTWTATFDSSKGYYDLLNCNKSETSSTDEYMHTCEPETLALYDEEAEEGETGYGVTYLVEQPMTAFGYLPNVVGRIKIPIPQNATVKIGDLESAYVTDYILECVPVEDLGEWKNLLSPLQYDSCYMFWTMEGVLYDITAWTSHTLTTATVNNVTCTNDWQFLSNVTSVSFNVTWSDGDTSEATKTFDEPVVIKFKLFEDGSYQGIEWYYLEIDDDDEFEEIDGVLYRKRRYDYGNDIEVGSEFQEPLHYGLHSPKPTDTQGVTEELWENRFLVFTMNGARSFEIPEIEKWKRSGGETDTKGFRTWTLGAIKTDTSNYGNRYVFHRDDLGEITFDLNTYTADSDGDLPIMDLFKGSGGLINWLTVDYVKKTSSSGTKYWGKDVLIEPRFDTLSGSELYRFINNGNRTLKVKGDFGASFSGQNIVDTTGSVVDESEYNNSETLDFTHSTYYNSKLHGTCENPQTNISLTSSAKTRTFEKVVDGCKYWWSVGSRVLSAGKILRNSAGKILRNSLNKILRGSDY